MKKEFEAFGFLLAVMLIFSFSGSGCGFYFKTYRFSEKSPFLSGMSEEDVLAQWGNPLGVQTAGPQNIWKYLASSPQNGKKTEYYLVWFQNGRVIKWGKTEEEAPARESSQ
ncbi:MAG TPA: hypothetical protein PKL97_07415 [Candidatus Omnitrophota bacterium]|nr:hypothetical protein [Candidatus Omnitrophota bacterium]